MNLKIITLTAILCAGISTEVIAQVKGATEAQMKGFLGSWAKLEYRDADITKQASWDKADEQCNVRFIEGFSSGTLKPEIYSRYQKHVADFEKLKGDLHILYENNNLVVVDRSLLFVQFRPIDEVRLSAAQPPWTMIEFRDGYKVDENNDIVPNKNRSGVRNAYVWMMATVKRPDGRITMLAKRQKDSQSAAYIRCLNE